MRSRGLRRRELEETRGEDSTTTELSAVERMSQGWPALFCERESLWVIVQPRRAAGVTTEGPPTHSTAASPLALPASHKYLCWVLQGRISFVNLPSLGSCPSTDESELSALSRVSLAVLFSIAVKQTHCSRRNVFEVKGRIECTAARIRVDFINISVPATCCPGAPTYLFPAARSIVSHPTRPIESTFFAFGHAARAESTAPVMNRQTRSRC